MAVDSKKDQQDPLLMEAVREWETAMVLCRGPAWKGKPAARHFVDLLKERPDLEQELVKLFDHKRQLVTAYSLFALELMDSKTLEHLPESLLARKEKVSIRMGSFGDKMELCAFARHLQKRWRKKHQKSSENEDAAPVG